MKPFKIAFDVTGTLTIYNPETNSWEINQETINLLKFYKSQLDCYIIVWSGAGKTVAENTVNDIGIKDVDVCCKKGDIKDVDVCYDDETVSYANINIQVKPVLI